MWTGIAGGFAGLFLALIFAAPTLLAVVIGVQSSAFSGALGVAAAGFLASFLAIYVYAVLSAYLLVLVMHGIAAWTGLTGVARWVVHWFLAAIYLACAAVCAALLPALLTEFEYVFPQAALLSAPYAFAGLSFALTAPLQLVAVAIVYGFARYFAPAANVADASEFACRGILIGFNAGANFALGSLVAAALFAPFVTAPLVPGMAWGCFCGLVSLAGSWMPTSSTTVNLLFRFVLGWCSWLLPTSWPAIALGWLLFLLNLLGHVLLSFPINPWWGMFTINEGRIYFPCGTANVEGGICANLWPVDNPVQTHWGEGYNFGPFVFIHAATNYATKGGYTIVLPTTTAIGSGTLEHESGHNLNLAALGSWYHLVGAIDEAISGVGMAGRRAHSERLAESNVYPASTFPWLPCWRP